MFLPFNGFVQNHWFKAKELGNASVFFMNLHGKYFFMFHVNLWRCALEFELYIINDTEKSVQRTSAVIHIKNVVLANNII